MSLKVNQITSVTTASTAETVQSTNQEIDLHINGKGYAVEQKDNDRGLKIKMLKDQAKKAGIPESEIMGTINSGAPLDSIKIDVKNHSLKTTSKYADTTFIFKNNKRYQIIDERKTNGKVTSKEVMTFINEKGDLKVERYALKNGKMVLVEKPYIWTAEEQEDGV